MVLPAPTGSFPAPTGLFPASSAASDPMFGVNPYSTSGTNMYLPHKYTDPNLTLPDPRQRAVQQQQLMQMSAMSQLGVPVESNPNEWTAETAAGQTDQAIAKIAAVNPELADELAAKRTGQPVDDGQSFWDDLKDLAGDIIHPVLSIGGKALDLISRTANIVPNLAFDAVDGGDFNGWADVGGALSGNVRHNWNSVFQEAGWEGGGIGGVFRAALGFGLDVATDPLTWVIPAGSALHAAEKGATLGFEAGARAETVLSKARGLAEFAGMADDDIAKAIIQRGDVLRTGTDIAGKGLFTGDDGVERVLGMVSSQYKGAEREMMSSYFEIADRMYKAKNARNLTSLLKNGLDIEGGRIEGSELKTILGDAVKRGNFTGRADGWREAMRAASAMGGTRFKAVIPFTNLRYISPALPGSLWLSEHSIGVLSRMASGASGQARLVDAISAGRASWDDLTTWTEEGFSALYKKNPEVVDQLRGRLKNMGSMFYSASEQVGRITEHMTSGARATRSGLGGYLAHAEELRIKNAYNQFVRETANNVDLGDGKRLSRQELMREMEGTLGVSLRKKGKTATDDQLSMYADYLDLFPSDLDTANPMAIEAWYKSLPEVQYRSTVQDIGQRGEAVAVAGPLTAADASTLARMQEVAGGLNEAQKSTLAKIQAVWDHARNEAAKKDAVLGDVRMEYAEVGRLHPAQVEAWRGGQGHPLTHETFYMDVTDAGQMARLRSHGISSADAEAGEFTTGVRASRAAGGGHSLTSEGQQVEVALRGGKWVIVDERTGQQAVTSEAEHVAEVRAGVDEAMVGQQQAYDAISERPTGSQLSAKEADRKSSDLTTAQLQKENPDHAGVIHLTDDGASVEVWDPQNVKVVDDRAPQLVQKRGYFHRTFTDEAKELLNGKQPSDSATFLLGAPDVQAYFARQTIGMTRPQAEAFVRKSLANQYGEEAVAKLPAVFKTDVLDVHMDYIDKLGKAIAGEMTGNASERFVALGDLAPTLFGHAPSDKKYEWMMNPGVLRALKNKDSKLTRSVIKMNERGYRYMEEQHAQLAKVAEEQGLFAAMVEESIAAGVDVPDRVVRAARRYGKTVGEARSAIAKERSAVESKLERLTRHDAAWDAIDATVESDPVVGHPGPAAPIAIREGADGTHTVLGWHADLLGGLPQGGEFHIGSYAQAKARLDQLADNEGFTIGSRDPATWDTVPVEVGGSLEALPGETNEAFMARLEATPPVMEERAVAPDHFYEDLIKPVQADVKLKPKPTESAQRAEAVASGTVKDVNGKTYLRAETVKGLPKELDPAELLATSHRADIFQAEGGDGKTVSELMDAISSEGFDKTQRVQVKYDPATGRYKMGEGFHRAKAMEQLGDPVPVEYTYEDLSAFPDLPVLGEPRGPGMMGTPELGDIDVAAERARGYEGAVYENQVEWPGESVVVFDSDGKVTVPDAKQRLEELADDGRLYQTPEGKLVLKKEAGAKKVPSRESLANQREALARRKQELSDLDRKVEGKGPTPDTQSQAARAERDRLRAIVGDPKSKRASEGMMGEDDEAAVQLAQDQLDWATETHAAREVEDGVLAVDHSPSAYASGHTVYYSVDEAGKVVGYRKVLEDGRVSAVTFAGGRGVRGADGRSVADVLVDSHWADKGVVTADQIAEQLTVNADSMTQGGAKLAHRAIDRRFNRLPSAESKLAGTADAAASLGAGVEAKTAAARKAGEQAGRKLHRLRTLTANAMNEANKAYAEFHQVAASVKPSLVEVGEKTDLTGLTPLHIPGLEGLAMPHYIAEEFHSLVDKHGIGHLRQSWRDYVLGPWKRWATYRWPGFHVRNFFGAFFNNWLGGVVNADYVWSWRVTHAGDGVEKWAARAVSDKEFDRYNLGRIFGQQGKGTVKYSDVADVLAEQGIGRANTMAVMGIGEATEATQEVYRTVGHKNPRLPRRAVRKFDDIMRSAGSGVEDFHRVAAWGAGMSATQGDIYGARAFVMMRHGDYADLTGSEDFIRDLVPFYKWQRTNVPYQLRMLAENPQATTMALKAKRAIYDAQGIDYEAAQLQQPEWMKQTMTVPIPSWIPLVGSKDKDNLKFAMFDLPYADLYNGLNDYMSQGLPLVRNVLESYGFKQQLFSGKPITGKYVPLSGVFNLPGVRDILSAVNLTKKGADGQLYMKDQVQNVLMGWPIYSRFRNFAESDPTRVENRLGGMFSMISGVGIRPGDYTQAELDFYYNELQPLMDQYKSLGIQLPTVEDIQGGHTGAASDLFAPAKSSSGSSPFGTSPF